MENNASNYGWFAAGAILGAAAALLLAPASGEQTRKAIGNKAGEGKEALTESSKEFLDKSREIYERGRAIAEDAADLFERGRKLVRG